MKISAVSKKVISDSQPAIIPSGGLRVSCLYSAISRRRADRAMIRYKFAERTQHRMLQNQQLPTLRILFTPYITISDLEIHQTLLPVEVAGLTLPAG